MAEAQLRFAEGILKKSHRNVNDGNCRAVRFRQTFPNASSVAGSHTVFKMKIMNTFLNY